jgi:rod shape-determining protein MreC
MHFFVRYSSVTVLVVCLSLSLLMMSSGDNPLSRTVQAPVRPLQRGLSGAVQGTGNLWHRYVHLVEVEQVNEGLRTELSETQQQLVALEEARHERDRLRALLGFQQRLGRPAIAARVIGWDSSHYAESIICDRGSRDGVVPNMCVTTSDGLVGRVLRVSAGTCQVQLVLDELSNVAALVQKNRVPGSVTGQGAGKPLLMRYVAKGAELVVNDAVVASGIDGIYHKGLLIGYVSEVVEDSTTLFQKIHLRPSVDLSRVEEVLIFNSAMAEPELEPIELEARAEAASEPGGSTR